MGNLQSMAEPNESTQWVEEVEVCGDVKDQPEVDGEWSEDHEDWTEDIGDWSVDSAEEAENLDSLPIFTDSALIAELELFRFQEERKKEIRKKKKALVEREKAKIEEEKRLLATELANARRAKEMSGKERRDFLNDGTLLSMHSFLKLRSVIGQVFECDLVVEAILEFAAYGVDSENYRRTREREATPWGRTVVTLGYVMQVTPINTAMKAVMHQEF